MFTPDNPRRGIDRRTLLVAGGSAAAGGAVVAGLFLKDRLLAPSTTQQPEAGKKQPLPPAIPKIESILSPDKLEGASWAIKLSENSVLPENTGTKDAPKPPSTLVVDQTVYLRHQNGLSYAVDAQEGRVIWKSPSIGTVLAADASRVVFLDSDSKVQIFDTQTGRSVGNPIAPDLPGVPPTTLAQHWRYPARIGQNFIALPYARTIPGSRDGVLVLDRASIEQIWKSPESEHTWLLGVYRDKLIVGLDSKIIIRKPLSQDRPLTIFTSNKSPNFPVFALHENFVATILHFPPQPQQGTGVQAIVYNLETGESTTSMIMPTGWFDQNILNRQPFCRLFCDLKFQELSLSNERGYLRLLAAAYSDTIRSGPYAEHLKTYFYFISSMDLATQKITPPGTPTLVESAYRFITRSGGGVQYTSRPSRIRTYTSFDLPRDEGSENGKVLYVSPGDGPPFSVELGWEEDIEYIGQAAGLFIFTSLTHPGRKQPATTRKVFATDRRSIKWHLLLDTTTPNKAVIAGDAIYAIGESLVKIDPATGASHLLAYIGAGNVPKSVSATQTHILVETSDNRLISFPLSSLG